MAITCEKCGAALPPGAQFCSACGAVAQPAGGSMNPAPGPLYAQPAPAGAPVHDSGASALKIVLVVIGALAGLGMLAIALFAFTVWRVSHTIHRSADGVTVSTSNGSVSMRSGSAATAADLGVPIYPGAVRGEGGVQIRSSNSEVVSAVYLTPDASSKVVDFYKNSLPGDAEVRLTGLHALMTAGDKNKETWMISVDTDSSDSSKTKITIMHVKKF